jgi:ZIP family zinc transporter
VTTTKEETSPGKAPEKPRLPRIVLAAIPVALLGALIAFLLLRGAAGIFPGEFPPVEDLSFGRVTIKGDEVKLVVTNGGPAPVTVAQVLVDEAYWQHSVEPARTIQRLRSATVTIPYPIVEGEPVGVVLVSSTGVTFEHTINVATDTPAVDGRFLWTFALVGLYVGVIPVLMGMTWMPFLRTLSVRWLHFFMAFTAGVLVFLGVEALVEAIESSEELPTAAGGLGVVSVAAIGSFALILVMARRFRARPSRDRRIAVAFAVAAGIGLHNLGEGLAIGAAYRLGEIALGAFLVIGFAIHNTTEGIGIVSIISDRKAAFRTLLALGLVAGVPTVLGAWGGAFLFSPLLATIFLAIAAGAIAEVIFEVMRVVRDEAPGGLTSPESLLGITVGLVIMYATGLLVAA